MMVLTGAYKRKMTEDSLTKLYQEIDQARLRQWGSGSRSWTDSPELVAERFEKTASKLEDNARKKQALEEAANHYARAVYSFGNESIHKECGQKAIKLYKKLGRDRYAEDLAKTLRREAHQDAIHTLDNLLNAPITSHDFRELENFPELLEDAGLKDSAARYALLIKEILSQASKDLEELRQQE